MRVQVSRVDLDGRRIDFRLVREGEELLGRAMKDKGVDARGPAAKAGKKAAAAKKPARLPKSPIQELKSAVKKAAAKAKSRKSRR